MRQLGRRVARWTGLMLLGLGMMGMGALGGGGRDAGLPARDVHATLTDVDGVHIEVSRLTIGGDTSIEGDVGRGRLRIPFDNIRQITIEGVGQDRDRVRARVDLRDGEPVTLVLRGATTFYGATPSGAYQIRARDLRSVDVAQR